MKFIAQHDQMDCGPACIAMVTKMYGKEYSLQYLREYLVFYIGIKIIL